MTTDAARAVPRARVATSLVLLGFAVFTAVVYEMLPVGLLTPIAEDLGVSERDAGFLISAFSVVVVLGSIPLSALTARFSARATLLVVLACFSLSAAVMAMSSTLALALVARAIGGLGHAVLFTALYRIALSLVAAHRQALAATTVSAGNALAFALGVPLATTLGALTSWRVALLVIAAVFVALIVAAVLLLPRGGHVDERRFTTREILRAAVRPHLLRVAITIVIVLTAQFLTFTYVEPLMLAAGIPGAGVGAVLLAYGAASVVGLVAVSRLAHTRPAAALACALALIIAALVFLWLGAGSPAIVIPAVVVWGLGFGMLPVLLNVLALRASPALPEASAPVSNTAFNIGITLGAILGGQAIALGDSSGALALLSAGGIAVTLLLALLPRWLPRDGRLPERQARSAR